MALAATLTGLADEPLTARKVFAEAPLEVIDMLRPSTRLDMIDYYTQADSIFHAPDALGGTSRVESLTDDYMRVAVTPVSTLEIKILPYRKGFIAMTLYTVGGEGIAKDTEVAFYDSDLQPLPSGKFLKQPDASAFFNLRGSDITEADLREWMPFRTVAYSTGPGDAPLTATLTTLAALSDETRERLGKVILSPRTAPWKSGYRF